MYGKPRVILIALKLKSETKEEIMKLKVINIDGKKTENIELLDEIFSNKQKNTLVFGFPGAGSRLRVQLRQK